MQSFGGGDRRHRRSAVFGGAQPGVTALTAEPIEACLGLFDTQIVGEVSPPPLRCSVIGFLHCAFAVSASRWADGNGDAVMFRDAGEAGGDPARVRVADCGHPVEPPDPADSAESSADPVESVYDLGLGHVRCEDAAPFTRTREGADEQVGHRSPAPGVRWVG